MTTLVITLAGDDRPGLVSALADVVAEHGGSWGRSQLAELAGTFAGIVTVEVPADRADRLVQALDGLHGVLDTTVQQVADGAGPEPDPGAVRAQLDLVGHDQPGIVQQISAVLARAGVSVERLDTEVVPGPQAGGELFQARATLRIPAEQDLDATRAALEQLAQELQVDLGLGAEDRGADWE